MPGALPGSEPHSSDSGLTRVIKITLDGPRASRYQSSITHKMPRAPLSRVQPWSEVSGVCSNIGRKIMRRHARFLQFLFRHFAVFCIDGKVADCSKQLLLCPIIIRPHPSVINRTRTPDTRHQTTSGLRQEHFSQTLVN